MDLVKLKLVSLGPQTQLELGPNANPSRSRVGLSDS
jgi:hypothetical protein